jgi:hypothetical protein
MDAVGQATGGVVNSDGYNSPVNLATSSGIDVLVSASPPPPPISRRNKRSLFFLMSSDSVVRKFRRRPTYE